MGKRRNIRGVGQGDGHEQKGMREKKGKQQDGRREGSGSRGGS